MKMITRAFRKAVNSFTLSYYFNVQNRKGILITAIGLILAVSIIFESSLLIYNQERAIFESIGERKGWEDISIVANYTDVEVPILENNFDFYQTEVITEFNNSELNNSLKTQYWSTLTLLKVEDVNATQYTKYIYQLISPEIEFFELIDPYLTIGSLSPRIGTQEVIYIKTKNPVHENTSIGDVLALPNSTMTVIGILDMENLSPEANEILMSFGSYIFNLNVSNSILFFTPPTNLYEILDDVPLFEYKDKAMYNIILHAKILLDYSKLNLYSLPTEIDRIMNLYERIKEKFFIIDQLHFSTNSRLVQELELQEGLIFQVTLTAIFLNQPLLGIALYMLYYSFNIINKPKRALIGNLKVRGCPSFKILMSLIGELLTSTIIALGGGVILSMYLLEISLRSSDLLTFTGTTAKVYFSIDMIPMFLVVTILISLFINTFFIADALKQKITETADPVDFSAPIWKRTYLDVIFIIIGGFGIIILAEAARATTSASLTDPAFSQLLIFLGMPSLLSLFFGALLLISRLFPPTISYLAELTWKYSGGLTGFTIKNIVRRQKLANKIILLIFLATTFTVITASAIESTKATVENYYYFQLGSDIKISSDNPSINSTLISQIKANFPNINGISYIFEGRYVYYPEYYSFIFVDPASYLEGAYYNPQLFGLSSSVSSLLKLVSDNESIIISEENLDSVVDFGQEKEIQLKFKFNSTYREYFNLSVKGTYKYWPVMDPVHPDREICIVGSIGLYENFYQRGYIDTVISSVLLKVDNLNEVQNIVIGLKDILPKGYEVKSIDSMMKENFDTSMTYQSILPILNSGFLVSMTVIILGLIMFGFHGYIERGKEIGVEKALGMTKRQIAYSFIIEAVIILFIGLIYATLIGLGITALVLVFINNNLNIEPPSIIMFPLNLLYRFNLSVIMLGCLGMIFPIFLSVRKDISRVLKVE